MSLSNITVSEFEDLRLGLMNYYNTEALTHAGYIVALLVAIFALLSSGAFIGLYKSKKKYSLIVFYGILSFIMGLVGYVALKTVFWSWMGSEVLVVTMQSANATQMPTWISGIQNCAMQIYGNSNPLFTIGFTTSGFSFEGLLAYFVISVSISLALCLFIGEFLLRNPRLSLRKKKSDERNTFENTIKR